MSDEGSGNKPGPDLKLQSRWSGRQGRELQHPLLMKAWSLWFLGVHGSFQCPLEEKIAKETGFPPVRRRDTRDSSHRLQW